MTGNEFRTALQDAGFTQKEFAETMGVHRTLIGRQFAAPEVDPYWAYALAGLLAVRTSKTIAAMVR